MNHINFKTDKNYINCNHCKKRISEYYIFGVCETCTIAMMTKYHNITGVKSCDKCIVPNIYWHLVNDTDCGRHDVNTTYDKSSTTDYHHLITTSDYINCTKCNKRISYYYSDGICGFCYKPGKGTDGYKPCKLCAAPNIRWYYENTECPSDFMKNCRYHDTIDNADDEIGFSIFN